MAIILIVAVVVVIFGSTQLPKLARSLGSLRSEFEGPGRRRPGRRFASSRRQGKGLRQLVGRHGTKTQELLVGRHIRRRRPDDDVRGRERNE